MHWCYVGNLIQNEQFTGLRLVVCSSFGPFGTVWVKKRQNIIPYINIVLITIPNSTDYIWDYLKLIFARSHLTEKVLSVFVTKLLLCGKMYKKKLKESETKQCYNCCLLIWNDRSRLLLCLSSYHPGVSVWVKFIFKFTFMIRICCFHEMFPKCFHVLRQLLRWLFPFTTCLTGC